MPVVDRLVLGFAFVGGALIVMAALMLNRLAEG